MNQQDRRQQSTNGGGSAAPIQRSAGKRSRSADLAGSVMADAEETDVPMGALQLSAASPPAGPSGGTASAGHDDPFGLHLEGSVAQRGVAGGGGRLPHLDTIQASFGRHDISGVSAHVGGAAAQASDALGAEAYATGSKIAFGSSPSLHTAAHEAAHVVQQRQGVSLKGGVGEAGDPYEQHADRVADAVVAGRSAEAMLDHGPGGGGSTGAAIQKEDKKAPAPPAPVGSDPLRDGVPDENPETEGDKYRKAVLEAAQARLQEKTVIVSEARVADTREGMVRFKVATTSVGDIEIRLPLNKPMKNFTTCIEFAGQTAADAAKAMGQGAKDQTNLGKLLPQFMTVFNKETEITLTLEAFRKAIEMFNEPLQGTKAKPGKKAKTGALEKQAATEAEIARLKEEQATNRDDKAAAQATDQKLKAQEQAKKQLDSHVAKIEKELNKIREKIKKKEAELAVLDLKDDAWIKPQPGMAGGRPKEGEYILIGAATTQDYGVSEETKVKLPAGAFKHIAVLESIAPVDPPMIKPSEKAIGTARTKGEPIPVAKPRPGTWEAWTTIDGGGTSPKRTVFYICLEDLLVYWAKPEGAWAVSQNGLIGWIDANTLMSDARKPGGAAPAPAPAAP